MWKSLKEYTATLGYLWFIVIVPIVLNILGIYQLIVNTQILNIDIWILFLVASVILLIIPFIAFHRMRMRLQNITESRARELARLILEVRDKAAKAVMRKQIKNQTQAELMDAYNLYSNALEILDREAEIDGGKIREAIIEGFTIFVSFHVTRFLAWNGKIVSDVDTKQKLEIDELQFVGRMASRADETIQKIRSLTR
jgi:ABC-type transport system involved in cytochrome bd biosynthesis fused ATPase/permease subunit